MIVRPYNSADERELRLIHASSGIDYRFPDLNSPLFIAKHVVERDGRATTLVCGRVEVETYLMTSGSAEDRLEDIESLQGQYLSSLWEQGIDNTYCMVPRKVDRHFGKHMRRLGWERGREEWIPYNMVLNS